METFDAEPLPASTSSLGLNEFIIVTVFPCGKQDGSHLKAGGDKMEQPYQLKIQKKMSENNLKDIFLRSKSMWSSIFSKYIYKEGEPNFSIYRKHLDMLPQVSG